MKTFARKKAVDLNTEVQEVELTVEPKKPKRRGPKKKKDSIVGKEK